MEKVYGYARVSTREQNLDRQIAALRQYVTDERDIITDKESGKDFDRTGYQYLRERLIRPGDTLIVKSLDRLGRNKEQVMEELRHFRGDGQQHPHRGAGQHRRAGATDHPPAAGRGYRRGEKAGQTARQEKDRVAHRVGVSNRAVEKWEHHRRAGDGPARTEKEHILPHGAGAGRGLIRALFASARIPSAWAQSERKRESKFRVR